MLQTLELHGVPTAETEVRTCGWLAQVDENGGSIFHYRPHSKGAEDMAALVKELLKLLGRDDVLEREKSTELPADPLELGSVALHGDNTPNTVPVIGIITADTDGGLSINHEQQHDQAA